MMIYYYYRNFQDYSWFFGQNIIFALSKKMSMCRRTHDLTLQVPHGNRCENLQGQKLARDGVLTQFPCFDWTWITYIKKVLSIKTILFDNLDLWCQLEVIRFLKTLSKHCMFVLFMKISACWLLHRLIKFNKICWEKRPAKPRPNLWTSFCRCDLKNTQPHLNNCELGVFRF